MTWTGGRNNTRAWRRLRQLILNRDAYRCTRTTQGQRCTNTATEVDHITPVHKGGTDHPTNLASVCHACHAMKTKQESAAARWKHTTRRPTEPHPGLNHST